MSANAIDFNDLERLGAESRLTENAPRALPPEPAEENAGIALIKALASLLTERGLQ